MKNFNLFWEKFEKLDFKTKKEMVRKIFELEKVLLYTVDFGVEKIIFRIYDGSKYYKFIFSSERRLDERIFKIIVKEIYVYCEIYVLNYSDKDDNFSKFMKMIKDGDFSYFEFFL